ncbi:MAG: PKD domain containing protein [Methanocalculus sp. 52_23]|nr:MAG: PKD domain containing protein [Methanocalculus sp. 52_23]
MYRSSAVSEVIGSILLISLVVLAVAVIGAGFLSQPPPVQTQDLNVIASNTTTTLYIYHDGGDPMVPGEFALLLDGNPVDPIPAPSGGWPWEIGEVLEIPITTTPQRIQIISLRGGQQNLIREISIGQVTGGGVPITPGTPPTLGPGGQCTQEELDEYAEEYLEDNYVEYFSEKLDEDAIYFTRIRLGNKASISGFVNLTINNTNSYIIRDVAPTRVNLTSGDRLSIKFGGHPNQASAYLFSVGNKGWSISGDYTTIYRNDVLLSGDLKESWITQYTDYESSLVFTSDGTNQFTRLIIKNQTIDEGVNNLKYEFINLKPAEPTLIILDYPNDQNDFIRFIGQANIVKRDGVTIYENGELLITP